MTNTMTTEIKIYVANLGKYNEGYLVGKWITLPLDEDEMNQMFVDIGVGHYDENGEFVHGVEIGGIVYEEYAIHDYEAPFKIDEYDSISELNKIAEQMQDLDDEQIKVAFAILNYGCVSDFEEAVKAVNHGDVYIFHEKNMSDIAYAWYEETGQLAELEQYINPSYINWEAIGRDMEIEGTFIEIEYGLWVEYIG
jgi:antirestriction protein